MIRRRQLRDQPREGTVAEMRAAWQELAELSALVAVRSPAALLQPAVESGLHCSGHRCVFRGCRYSLARHRSMNRWSSLCQIRLLSPQVIEQGLRSEPS